MMTRFTPGPWKHDQGYVFSGDGLWHGDEHGWIVARIARHNGEGDSEIDRANAVLIAAAPELYEALQELADLQNGPPLIKDEDDWNAAMAATWAALAKARGEQ